MLTYYSDLDSRKHSLARLSERVWHGWISTSTISSGETWNWSAKCKILRPEMTLGQFPVAMHHLRQDGRHEINLLLERRHGAVVAIEVKAGTTVDRHDARNLISLRDQLDTSACRCGIVFHIGKLIRKIGERTWAVPICALWS